MVPVILVAADASIVWAVLFDEQGPVPASIQRTEIGTKSVTLLSPGDPTEAAARAVAERAVQALAAGCNEYVENPSPPDTFVADVMGYLPVRGGGSV